MPGSHSRIKRYSRLREFNPGKAEKCPDRIMVLHKTGTLGLSRRPGSIPGPGVYSRTDS